MHTSDSFSQTDHDMPHREAAVDPSPVDTTTPVDSDRGDRDTAGEKRDGDNQMGATHGEVTVSETTATHVDDADIAGAAWDLTTKRTMLVILLIATIALIWISRPVIPLLIVSGIVAYLLKPIVDLSERIRIPRAVSTIFLFMLVLIAIILTPVLVIPILYRQLRELAAFDETVLISNLQVWLRDAYNNAENRTLLGIPIPIDDALQQIQQNIVTFQPTLEQILSYVQQIITTTTNVVGSTAVISFNVVGGVFQFFFGFLLIFFISLYLTKDAPTIRTYIGSLLPRSYQPEWEELLRRMGNVWQGFFRGQVALSLVIGFATWGALNLLSMPGALVLAIVAGMLEIIPNLGPTLAMIPAVIVALIQGSNNPALMEFGRPGFALMVVAVYFLIQQVENNIIVPRIIGDSVNLHPVVIMCGVVVGFSMGGVLGAFLAAPVIATGRVLGSYIHAKLLDYPPFQARSQRRSSEAEIRTYRRIVTGEELDRRREQSVERATADTETAQKGASERRTVQAQ